MTSSRDLEYATARNDAGKRHNFALLGHKAQPRSSGDGVGMDCDCDQRFTFEGYHRHVVEIILQTTVPSH